MHVSRHLHLRGPPIGYVGIALAAFASWAGVPGAGEAALVTGAAFAARHRLDIAQVELFGFVGAVIGGMVGWVVGARVGGTVAARPGPALRFRLRALRGGERFFERYGALAVFLTPSWIAGIHRVPAAKYIPANALAALVWVLGFGLATYFLGPDVADVFGDVGTIGTVLIVGLAVLGGVAALLRARRRR